MWKNFIDRGKPQIENMAHAPYSLDNQGYKHTHSCASACKTSTTQNQSHQISNTQRTENKTTDVVIQQHSRKLLKMDILMSETCWADDLALV